MTTNTKLKECYDIEAKYGAFYTGGNIEWHNNLIYCQKSSTISILNIDDGKIIRTIGDVGDGDNNNDTDEDTDYIQTFTTDGTRIVSSHKSGLLKLWNNNGELIKMWKYIHKGPIAKLCLNDKFLISGGSDSSLRVWDIEHQMCLANLRGCQGVINVIETVTIADKTRIFASGDDGKVASWDINDKNHKIEYYTGHYSKVTSLTIAHNQQHFITSGRDKVIILWKFNEYEPFKIVPTYENIEYLIRMPLKFKLLSFKSDPDGVYVCTGGTLGKIRMWDLLNSREIYKQADSLITEAKDDNVAITKLLCNENLRYLAVISADHNIIIYNIKSMICLKQFIGFSDEILDVALIGVDESFMAVATNSPDIKFYNNENMDCRLLKGHNDIVLALQTNKTNPNLLLSSGKDNKVMLWLFDNNQMNCIGIGVGHSGSIGTVCFYNLSQQNFLSGSQDTCIKLWEIPDDLSKYNKDTILNCRQTEIGHQKDINCITITPNDRIIATGSQDKTVKLWTNNLQLIGTLKGHKRSVWCVRFSPIDQIILTTSADCTLKLWSVTDLSCLKTFESHEASVLKAEFLSNGLQILSAGGDGLLKLFNIKTSECIGTFDQHQARVWALCVNRNESKLITGGSDSYLIKWHDVTEERRLELLKKQKESVVQEQKLLNFVKNNEYLEALKYALLLDRPLQVLKIIKNIVASRNTNGLIDCVKQLRQDQKESLLKCTIDWNTISKNCQYAQLVLNILLNDIQNDNFKPTNLRACLEGALPYTERHFKRITQLLQDLYFINYTINCMQPHVR